MKILLILGHPDIEHSQANKTLIESLGKDVTIHDISKIELTEQKIKEEQEFISKFDKIVFQYPIFWFTWPSVLGNYIEKVITIPYFFMNDDTTPGLYSGRIFSFVTTTGCDKSYYDEKLYTIIQGLGEYLSKACLMKYGGFWIKYNDEELDQQKIQSYKDFIYSKI